MVPQVNIIGSVLLVLLAARGVSAFHLPAGLAHVEHHGHGKIDQTHRVVLSLSKLDEDDGDGESRVPFFARALQKLRPKNENIDDGDAGDDDAGELVAENIDKAETKAATVDSESAMLRALAEKTRLEAEKMELSLSLAKINKLEGKISDKDERANILSDTQLLMRKISAPSVGSKGIVSSEPPSDGASVLRDKSSTTSDNSQQGDKKSEIQEMLGDKAPLSDDKRQDAIDGFVKLPQPIRDMMAKTVGMEDGTNATAVVDKLMEENRLFEGEENEKFSMIAKADDFENLDVFLDLEFEEINTFVKNLLPEVTRKEPVNYDYVDALYTEVLGKDTFNPRERKAQAIPGGYLIRGESKVKSQEGKDDGDLLIEALDKKISASSIAGKIQVHYILDPTPPSGEEIMNDEDENPVLLITNVDISPDTAFWVKPGVSFLSLISIALFALGSFAFNDDVVNRISASADSDSSLNWLYDLSLPLALSLLFTQIIHELGHFIIALKDGIKIGLPTFVPSLQFGLTGAITPVLSPPKNIKSLFDFAIAGPLLGLIASIILLYTGLEMTAFMDSSALEQLPGIPVEVLRSSALGGGIIDYLLGDGVLNSPDPQQMIKLHPYAIAGFGGLITNSLSLLPIGNTDGGRISIAFFGRAFSRVVQGTALFVLVAAGLFGGDQVNTLLCYIIFCQFWQKEAEVLSRNEVDELDLARGILAITVSLIVLLTLSPLPS